MELQRSLPDITAHGLGLAAISYDSVDTLQAFTEKHGLTFPLLSDEGSKTITAWGILNRTAQGRTAGIPYPGTYVISPRGVIVSRSFEEAYTERDTAASILAKLGAGGSDVPSGAPLIHGKYVDVRLDQTDRIAAPGHRFTLTADVTPGDEVHVYAPGQASYIPVALTIAPSPDYTVVPPVFPKARPYHYVPLNETVQVFDAPFRIAQDVALTLTPSMRQRAAARETLTLNGTLSYQACTDTVCFPPDTVPLHWTVTLAPIEGR